MRPYVLQNFKNDLGEIKSARMIVPNYGARVVKCSGTDVTISPEAGTDYHCGEVSSLTVSDFPEIGSFVVVFTSGTTAALLTVPTGLVMPENFTVEANTRYEINVQDGYALCAGWAVNANE